MVEEEVEGGEEVVDVAGGLSSVLLLSGENAWKSGKVGSCCCCCGGGVCAADTAAAAALDLAAAAAARTACPEARSGLRRACLCSGSEARAGMLNVGGRKERGDGG